MFLPWLLGGVTVLLPAVPIVWLWRKPGQGRRERTLRIWVAGGIVLFAFLSGAWAFTSHYLRYRLANPFHGAAERYALDVVKLNRLGNRAAGVAPRALRAYEIHGTPVYSPCTGTVLAARDGLPDNEPGAADVTHPEGNHVRLRCGDVDILLAHLMEASLTPKTGDTVAAGSLLGRVGNSGNSAEPHLHIAATRKGAAVPIAFGTVVPAVNDIVLSSGAT